MKTSVIIPTLNEAENITRLVHRLRDGGSDHLTEVIVVDAGSADDTQHLAKAAGATVLCADCRSRARQMNLGAAAARGELLYFVHGDTLPPPDYMNNIQSALTDGYPIGCFRFRFNSNRSLLKINSFMTRFNRMFVRGGDQSLYVTREVFDQLGGYREDFIIMEEYDFIEKAQKNYPFRIIPNEVLVSARKYDHNSYLKVQIANATVFTMYRLGFSQQRLKATYRRMLDYRH
ncbi:MAG: TIGR04283 family arsenosugar biosynthesis glycosyltransferase [Bacteroidota bacterium]